MRSTLSNDENKTDNNKIARLKKTRRRNVDDDDFHFELRSNSYMMLNLCGGHRVYFAEWTVAATFLNAISLDRHMEVNVNGIQS